MCVPNPLDEPAQHRLGDTSEIAPAPAYYYADKNQEYVAKNPFGYRCQAHTGIHFPQ